VARRKRAGLPWPTPRDMGDLVVSGEPMDRVLLGRLAPDTVEGQLLGLLGRDRGTPALAAPAGSGVLVVGASQTGKTSSIMTPAVLRWQGPVIVTSIRSDVLRHSWEAREQAGWPVLIYNPKNQGGYGSDTWSPLVAAMGDRPWVGATRMASLLIDAAGMVRDRDQDFWNGTAVRYLAPLLLAAAADGPSMEPVIRWLNDEAVAREELPPRLSAYPEALSEAESVWANYPKLRDSIYETTRVALMAYKDQDVRQTCLASGSGRLPDITPDTVLGTDGKPGATLYILSPTTDWEYFAPLFSALITSLLDAAYSRADADSNGKLDPPLLLALDEAANIAPIKDLPNYSSTAAGAGIQLITVLQDLGQAERVWGPESTRTLLTNHYGGRLILGGTVDSKTLDWVREMLGEVDRTRTTHNHEGVFGRTSTSVSAERQAVATAAEIRTMARGTALLIAGSYPVARVILKQWTTI
jgi:type IV secretion system protein VirD4